MPTWAIILIILLFVIASNILKRFFKKETRSHPNQNREKIIDRDALIKQYDGDDCP